VSSNDVGSIGSLYQKKGNLRNTPTTRAVQTVWGWYMNICCAD
jgi:hypothetical protein